MSLEVVYNGGPCPEIDIIAIHGFSLTKHADHAFDMWRKPAGEKGHDLWLASELPQKLPNARVMVYSYSAIPPYENHNLKTDASWFLQTVAIEREKYLSRPILLLGHDLGGVMIKEALVQAIDHPDSRHRETFQATFAIVFLGTPHRELHTSKKRKKRNLGQWVFDLWHGVFSRCGKLTNMMVALEKAKVFDPALEERWTEQSTRYRILSMCETVKPARRPEHSSIHTKLTMSMKTMPRQMATLGLPENQETVLEMVADHQGICHFDLNDNVSRSNLDDLLYYVCRFVGQNEKARGALEPLHKEDEGFICF